MQAGVSALAGFTRQAIAQWWANRNLQPDTQVLSDGLKCFAGVIDNPKMAISGAHKAFRFAKYASNTWAPQLPL